MTMIAEVAVSCAIFAIDQPYSYRIPQGMQILPGMRVVVPFGRANRRTEAIVLGVQTGSEDKLKAIEQLLDDAPVMTDEQLRLAAFVRERYFCTYYDAVKAGQTHCRTQRFGDVRRADDHSAAGDDGRQGHRGRRAV